MCTNKVSVSCEDPSCWKKKVKKEVAFPQFALKRDPAKQNWSRMDCSDFTKYGDDDEENHYKSGWWLWMWYEKRYESFHKYILKNCLPYRWLQSSIMKTITLKPCFQSISILIQTLWILMSCWKLGGKRKGMADLYLRCLLSKIKFPLWCNRKSGQNMASTYLHVQQR